MNRTPKDRHRPRRLLAGLRRFGTSIHGVVAALAAAPLALYQRLASNREAAAAERKSLAGRMAAAIERLEAEPQTQERALPDLQARLDAIATLAYIVRASERYHIAIIEILCTYVRRNAPASEAKDHGLGDWKPLAEGASEHDRAAHLAARPQRFASRLAESKAWNWAQALDGPRADVQAALTAIGRRPPERIAHERRQRKRYAENDPGFRLDLSGTNLQGAGLAGLDLAWALLTGSRLEGADLRQARLDGADLGQARLEGANLRQATLVRADLEQARLEGADLRVARLDRANLRQARLDGANLRLARLDRADLQLAQLETANLRTARLGGANLQLARLGGADLERARLDGANLRLARMQGAHLCEARFDGANMGLAWLERADLRRARLDRADLNRARLGGAHLGQAWLEGADLGKARLDGADLSEARLDGAKLGRAWLRGAKLALARLDGANLRRALLDGAILHSASLRSARLRGCTCARASLRSADLTDATGLTQEHLNAAYGDSGTRLPAGLARPDHWDPEVIGPGAPDPRYGAWLADGAPPGKPHPT